MVYVIQHWNGTVWENARFPDGQPRWYLTMRKARQELEKLDPKTHRIVAVKD